MTLSLAIVLVAALDVLVIALVAAAMSVAYRLTPHVGSGAASAAQPQPAPRELRRATVAPRRRYAARV